MSPETKDRFRRVSPGEKPSWLKVPRPQGPTVARLTSILRERGLHTVCEEARCPNMGECWDGGTATFMVLGDTCTRGCRFCAVKTHSKGNPVDSEEPKKVAESVVAMGLRYVVLTMVDRDDLPDGGAAHVAATVREIKRRDPSILVEALTGDFRGDSDQIATAIGMVPTQQRSDSEDPGPEGDFDRATSVDVFAHNIETVLRLTPRVRDQRCSYVQTLGVLRRAKELRPDVVTKSSVMLGLGETDRELDQVMDDLREFGVDVVTFGQYLRPTLKHLPVREHVTPARFQAIEKRALKKGFLYVASGPLVRSSYKAAEYYIEGMLRRRQAESTSTDRT